MHPDHVGKHADAGCEAWLTVAAVPGDANGLVNLRAVERSWQSRNSHSNQEALMGCWL